MTGTVTDIIAARARTADQFTPMVLWSVAAHVIVVALVWALPESATRPAPQTVMTISLGGAPGPRSGGLTQMGGRPVQAPPPPEPARRPEPAPAPTPPKMALPDPRARARPTARPEQAPDDASSKTPTTGERPQEGSTRAETQVRGQGFGLSTAGGSGGPVQLDVTNFCCPEYIIEMISLVQRNWQQNVGIVGVTLMKFTIARDGSIQAVQVERPSGFVVLDNAADRALRLTAKLPALPAAFPNPTLTVHMEFEYQR
jgi:TonB family protein